jgi:hypothetical protein
MSPTELIDAYCAVWNEDNPARREQQLAAVWAKDASYTDPTVNAAGAAELLDHIASVRERRPGARVERTTQVDYHHGLARFGWHIVEADGTTLPDGLDVVTLTPDGTKLARVVGFFGPLST